MVRARSGRYSVAGRRSLSRKSSSCSTCSKSNSWCVPPKRFGGLDWAPRPLAIGRSGSGMGRPPRSASAGRVATYDGQIIVFFCPCVNRRDSDASPSCGERGYASIHVHELIHVQQSEAERGPVVLGEERRG